MSRRIAVIGGGWAGIAAAVAATEAGHQVTLFEMAPQLGGRARRVDHSNDLSLDNGQHILIGAYRDTLSLMRRVGADPDILLRRLPLALVGPDGNGLRLPAGVPMLAFTRAVLGRHGWSLGERLGLLAAAPPRPEKPTPVLDEESSSRRLAAAGRLGVLGVVLLLAFTFFMGLMLSRILQVALGFSNGGNLIAMAAGGTGAIFVALAGVASSTKRDFSNIGKFLFAGVILLLVAMVANIFFQIPALALTALRIFNTHGNRENRRKARLRHIRQELGDEAFISLFKTEYAACMEHVPPGPPVLLSASGMHPAAEINVPCGLLTPDQADALAEILKATHACARIHNHHRIALFAEGQRSRISQFPQSGRRAKQRLRP
jgi:hypothetical protein